MVERTLISFPSQLQLIERLQHLLYLSSSIIFISGEEGSGKSTLVEQLSNQLPSNTQQVFVSLSEPSSVAQIRLQIISQLFDKPLFDADDSLSNSLILLKDKRTVDINRTIIIDNAGLIPESLLIELAQVIQQKSAFTDNEINFILLSDDVKSNEMTSAIKQSSNLVNVATLTFKLAPLSSEESKQLLNHRFAQMGYAPQMQHQDALAQQLSRCQGIPTKILLLATEVSSGELVNSRSSWFKTRFPAILIMFILVAIASALTVYLYPKFIKKEISVDALIESVAVLPAEIQITDVVTEGVNHDIPSEALAGQWQHEKLGITDNPLSVGEADNQQRVTISERQLLQLSVSEGKKTVTEYIIELSSELAKEAERPLEKQKKQIETDNTVARLNTLPKESERLLENQAPPVEAKLLEQLDKPEDIIVKIETFMSENVDDLVKKLEPLSDNKITTIASPIVSEKNSNIIIDPVLAVTELSLPAVPELVASKNNIEPVILHPVTELQEAVLVEERLTSVEQVTLNQTEQPKAFSSVDTLLNVDADIYTLQLIGMSSEKTLNEFIKQHHLPRKNVYLYETVRNKKPWYVVIYGQFESREAANRVAKKLPNTLNILDSWVKKYSSVHQDITLNE